MKTAGAAMLLGMFLLMVRVVDLQGFRGSLFRQISDDNRQFRLEIPAERGVFLDRFGDPLVMNTRRYFRYSDPLALYSSITPLPANEALAAQVTDPFSVGYTLQRRYVWPNALAHALGYVSVVNPEDLAADSTLGFTDVVGRMGLELQYDTRLRGRAGYQEFEINAAGQKQAAQASYPPVAGQSVTTTLDPYLSAVAWRAMGNTKGSVVILDSETGNILALVSTPGFNSNVFAATSAVEEAERQTALQQALTDERQLFFNRSVSGTYPPGSIFKLVTAAAGLESGAFDLSTTVDDQGVLRVGEQSFANWYYTQYGRTEGTIALVRAISRSNDTFFYKAAEWTGVDALAQKAREFGFGVPTGVEIPGEKAGLVPDPAWKEKTLGERWFLGNTYHLGIGQGDVLVTPLQLARMVAAFGNGGKVCPLHLVAAETVGHNEGCSELGLSEETIAAIREGMIGACSAGGTAFPFFPWNTQQKALLPEGASVQEQLQNGVVACKTGTAEFGGENELGHRRTHGWFGMTVGGMDGLIGQETASSSAQAASSTLAADETQLDLVAARAAWLQKVETTGFPREITMLILVESDDDQPFKEGSRDAAPIALAIFDWMTGY